MLDQPSIAAIAQAHDVTPAQVVLRWHVQLGNVVIPKSSKPERMASNLDVFSFELSTAEMATVSGLDQGASGRVGPDPDDFEVE